MNKTILAGFAALAVAVGAAHSQTCTDIPPGLAAWWRAENNALDTLGTNHGTLQNGASFGTAMVNQGFSLDGLNDYVSIPTSPELQFVTDFSISVWAKADTTTGTIQTIVSRYDFSCWNGLNNCLAYILRIDTDAVPRAYFASDSGNAKNCAGPPVDTNWHHYAITYSTASVTLFVDGAAVSTVATAQPVSSKLISTAIGANSVGSENFKGLIDEVAMFNRVLSSNEVAAIYAAGSAGKCIKTYFLTPPSLPDGGVGTPYSLQFAAAITPGPHTFSVVNGTLPSGLELATNGLLYGTPTVGATNSFTILATSSLGQTNTRTFSLNVLPCLNPAPSGLVAWWRAQDDALDAMGANHGTLQNGANFATGKVGRAFSFDGVDDHATVPDSTLWDFGQNDFSIELWINLHQLKNSVFVSQQSGATFGGFAFHYFKTEDKIEFNRNTGNSGVTVIGRSWLPQLNQWYHLAVTRTSGTYRLYVDGQQLGTEQFDSNPVENVTGSLRIGNLAGLAGFEVAGELDEIGIFSKSLASNEVAAIYAAGAGGKGGLLYMTSSSPLPGAGEGAAYSQLLVATGGTAPYNFTLLSGALPAGLSLSPAGVLSGMPTVPGVSEFTVRVNDAQTRPADRHFFLKVNARPVLPVIAGQSVNELATLTVTNAATDADPLDTLSYALINSPANASISASRVITWTPTEAQGSNNYTITTVVTDNGEPNLSRTNTFTVVVNELNVAPVLSLPANTNINELLLYTAQATATDADEPANALAFALVSGPDGLTVSPAGEIAWMPAENQGPSTNTVIVRVTDTNTFAVNATSLSVTSSFNIVVNEVNAAPVLDALSNRTVNAGQTVSFTATATDGDLPANVLAYSLLSPPVGADITSSGLFTWRPAVAQADTTNTIQVRVRDNGAPVSNDVKSFTLVVNPLAQVVLNPLSSASGQFRFTVNGSSGPDYVILHSGNLTNWTDLATNLSPILPFEFSQPIGAPGSNQFYRVRLQP